MSVRMRVAASMYQGGYSASERGHVIFEASNNYKILTEKLVNLHKYNIGFKLIHLRFIRLLLFISCKMSGLFFIFRMSVLS